MTRTSCASPVDSAVLWFDSRSRLSATFGTVEFSGQVEEASRVGEGCDRGREIAVAALSRP
jgi:hypothetical protein